LRLLPAVSGIALLDAPVAADPVADSTVRPADELRFLNLGKPLGAMPRSIDRRTTAGNGPAAVECFDPTHHSADIWVMVR